MDLGEDGPLEVRMAIVPSHKLSGTVDALEGLFSSHPQFPFTISSTADHSCVVILVQLRNGHS